MPRIDLVFNQQSEPIKGGPVRIVFGAGADMPVPTVTLEGGGRVTGLRGHVRAHVAAVVSGGGTITGMRGSIQMRWDANVSRGARAPLGSTWQEAASVSSGAQSRWQEAAAIRRAAIARWQEGAPARGAVWADWQEAVRVRAAAAARWQQASPVRTAVHEAWQEAARLRATIRSHYQKATPLRAGVVTQWQEAERLRAAVQPHWQDATPVRTMLLSGYGDGRAVWMPVRSHWQEAVRPGPGRSKVVPPIKTPCYVPKLPVELVFFERADSSLPARLVFRCDGHGGQPEPGETIVIPIQRTYIVLNSIALRRVSDDAVIAAAAFSMSLDVSSWTWSWQATIQGEDLGLIASDDGTPVQVRAIVNSVPYTLLAERWTRERSFGSDRISVTGRGLSALLDAPFAPTLNHTVPGTMTAHQLMQQVLTINGVSLDWVVSWGLTDWQIPAGVWSLQGSYMAALTDIATAAGGYVQPHNTDRVLRILPRYPKQPWLWDTLTPDIQLPSQAVEVEGTEWVQNPAYNLIYVGDESTGFLGEVLRAGTPGDFDAPMVTHPLITDMEAARQRGIAELSAAGKSETVTLSLQVLPQTGLIMPGKTVRYVDRQRARLGIARSVTVSWDGKAKLRQRIALEVPEVTA